MVIERPKSVILALPEAPSKTFLRLYVSVKQRKLVVKKFHPLRDIGGRSSPQRSRGLAPAK